MPRSGGPRPSRLAIFRRMRWRWKGGAFGLPGSHTRWVAVTTVASGFEADVAVAVLGAAGIPARAAGNDLTGIFGPNFQGPTARGVDVLVPEDAADEARTVLAETRAAADAADDEPPRRRSALMGEPPTDRYPIPASEHRTREEISRSRFVTTVAPAATIDDAQAFLARMRAEFPDATHHCWAYVVGAPGSTSRIGMSDDGEPHGTAGRPMLTALLHGGVGDVAAVVTRHYGGTKLGTGGLVRAYGGCVQRALESLPRAERMSWLACTLTIGYGDVTAVQQLIAAHEGRIDAERYAVDVTYVLALPDSQHPRFVAAVRDATRGQAVVG